MTEEMKKNELNEEQLEDVSGGGSWSTYSSGDTPKFKVGELVIYDSGTYYDGLGYVTEVSTEKSGVIYKEFTYTVEVFGEVRDGFWNRLDHKVECYDVWESDLKPAGNVYGL